MKQSCILIILIIVTNVHSIDLLLPASALQNASSGLILLTVSPSGTHYNPAYLQQGLEAGISYLHNLSDLPFYTFHSAYRFSDLGIYLGGTHLDNPLYKESLINLALNYGYRELRFGSALRLVHSQVPEYHNKTAIVADVGLIWQKDRLMSGFSLRNITNGKFGDDPLPVVFLSEFNYTLSGDFSISIGVEKERGYDFMFKLASSYHLYQRLQLLASYQLQPARIGAGFMVDVHPITVSYSLLTHQYLSSTHFFSIGYGIP